MATTIKRVGFGQVEPNHLSAQRTAQIYAQLPAKSTLGNIIENGRFVKYDLADGTTNLTGNGEWMLVYNEIKLYDDRRQMTKDYAMKKSDAVDGIMVPRVFKTNIGDIYTTNCVGGANTSEDNTYAGIELEVGDTLIVDSATGYLVEGTDNNMQWEVVKVYTMPDGQPAVKIVRVK